MVFGSRYVRCDLGRGMISTLDSGLRGAFPAPSPFERIPCHTIAS